MLKIYADKIHDSLERVTWELDEEDSDIEALMSDLYNEHYVDMEDLILMNTEAKVLINKYEKETA